jgi:UDP-glucuronate 4-epimerase
MMKKILVTGCAGFIGSNLVDKLLAENYDVVGIDNFNDYYDPKIKEDNLRSAKNNKNFKLMRGDIVDLKFLQSVFLSEKPERVIHLAARAGVRPSIEDPSVYTEVNVLGTVNLLKLSVDSKIDHFIFGSSSAVYGNSPDVPFSEDDLCQNIISPYASSKRSAEFFIETFSKNYGLSCTGLRFFTVYGERGRIDMAPAKFTRALLSGKEITQYGDGSASRDYTYVGDIIEGILKALKYKFSFEIINLGNNHPVALSTFIKILEKVTGKKAKIKKMPMQKGDVERTWANIDKAGRLIHWEPKVKLEEGLTRYVNWLGRS